MKIQIEVIEEAINIILANQKDQKVINEQAKLIVKYAKELIRPVDNQTIKVKITNPRKDWWYDDKLNKTYKVKQPEDDEISYMVKDKFNAKDLYQVVSGKYAKNLIVKKDCTLVK